VVVVCVLVKVREKVKVLPPEAKEGELYRSNMPM